MQDARRRPHRVLVQRRRLRHPRRRPRHRRHPEDTRSRPTASPSSSASGCCATRRVAAGLRHTSPALLQRRRAPATPTSTTPARTTSSRSCSTRCVEGRTPQINGDDYPTPDGTNVRDYMHVADLAAGARRGGAATGCRRAARARLQPGQRRRASRSPRSWRRWRASPASSSPPRSARAAPGDPPRIVASGRARRARPGLADAAQLDEMVRARGRLARTDARRVVSTRWSREENYHPRLDAGVTTTV